MFNTHIYSIKKQKEGFTLIELLMVLTIISLLASIVFAFLTGAREKAIDARFVADLKNVSVDLEIFHTEHKAYPATVDCASPESSTNTCLPKSDPTTLYTYTVDDPTDPQSYTLYASGGSSGASMFYEISSESQNPVVAGNLGDITIIGSYNPGDTCNTSYYGGGCPIEPSGEAIYPANLAMTTTWDNPSSAIVSDDTRAVTTQNGDQVDFTFVPAGASGTNINKITVQIESSAIPIFSLHNSQNRLTFLQSLKNTITPPLHAANSSGQIIIQISTDGGSSFTTAGMTEILPMSDKDYRFELSGAWPSSVYGQIVARAIAQTENSAVRIDSVKVVIGWYSTGGGMGGGGAIE